MSALMTRMELRPRAVARIIAAGLALVMLACSDETMGPSRGYRVELVSGGDSLSAPPGAQLELGFQVSNQDSRPAAGFKLLASVEGGGAVLSDSIVSDPDGRFSLVWQLGTDARRRQTLQIQVAAGLRSGASTLSVVLVPDQITSLSTPDTLATRLNVPALLDVSAVDSFGNVFRPGDLVFRSSDTGIFVLDSAGVVHGRSRGTGFAIASARGLSDTTRISIFQIPVSIAAPDTVHLHSLGQLGSVDFLIVSDSGHPVRDTLPGATVSDTTVAVVEPGTVSDTSVLLRTRRNGLAILTLQLGGLTRNVPVVVGQQSRSLHLNVPSLQFSAIGDSAALSATAADSLGQLLANPVFSFTSGNSTVAQVSSTGVVSSRGNGSAAIIVREASGARDSVLVTVQQIADTVEAVWTDTSAIVLARRNAPLPLACRAVDRNGFPLSNPPLVIPGNAGTVSMAQCSSVTAIRSGFDTLTVVADGRSVRVPIVLAVPPAINSPVGSFVQIDSMPTQTLPWAPSARLNSQGDIEVYMTGYLHVPDSNGVGPGALHRYRSTNGSTFAYDGEVLSFTDPCDLICSGFENIAIMSRQDGPGWRMLFAGGSSGTTGWQVFSAVSDDERTWTQEPGIRISNGGPSVPWPTGEGMVVDQLPSGEWRLIVSGYEPVSGAESKFQILEYRSTDQLTWTYLRTLVHTRQMPPEAQRSVYSPAIVETIPGMWRMYFVGDNTNQPGGRSRIYTAVSLDRVQWQLEGELLGAPGTNLLYAAVVGNRLYFLRQDKGGARRLATVTLTPP